MRKLIFTVAGGLFAALIALALYMETSVPGTMAGESLPTQPAMEVPVIQTEAPEEETAEVTEATEPAETAPTEEEGIQLDKLFQIVDGEPAYNGELQIYRAEQVTMEDNTVTLRAELVDGEYLSGKVVSKIAFRYGTFTFRMETTQKSGFFPAIWMLPASGDAFPEVDIYEAVGNDPNRIYGVLHRSQWEEEKDMWISWVREEQIAGTYELRFEWTPEGMNWYMDGEKVGSMTRNCPDIPMYMIFNLAVGGNWAGKPMSQDFPESYTIEILEFSPGEIYAR